MDRETAVHGLTGRRDAAWAGPRCFDTMGFPGVARDRASASRRSGSRWHTLWFS